LGIVQHQRRATALELGEGALFKFGSRLQSHRQCNLTGQRIASFGSLAPDEKPPGAESLGNPGIVQRLDRHSRFAVARPAQDRGGRRIVLEDGRNQVSDQVIATEAVTDGRYPRGPRRRWNGCNRRSGRSHAAEEWTEVLVIWTIGEHEDAFGRWMQFLE